VALALVAAVLGVRAALAPGGGPAASGVAPLSVLRTADFHALAFSPDNPDTVFFGHHNGVMRSDDGGRTWKALVDRRNFDAMGLAVSHANPRQIFLAGHDIFQVSTDGGVTWQEAVHNLPGTDIHGFAISPDDPSRLYAFVVGHGVFGSGDAGRTWQRLGEVPRDVMALAAAGGDPETLYAASMSAGVLRSTDGGKTWAPAVTGLGSRRVLALAVDPSPGTGQALSSAAPGAGRPARQTLYAGTEGGLYKSTDGGATWARLPFPGMTVVALAVSPARPQRILAISYHDGRGEVFRSDDGGATWGGR
jgi:photosystem II stability/assembly factor-like uncharacterized protein